MSLGSQSGSVEVYGCVPLNAGMMLAGKPGKVTMDLALTIADVTHRYYVSHSQKGIVMS